MPVEIDEMFAAAKAAQANAYAPYSRFRVGAAVLTAGGRIFSGCNVENAAYPQGSCAETGAISAMVAAGEREIVAVLTVTDGDIVGTCCGGCRQRISEFAGDDTPIYAAGADGVRATFTVGELLPHAFRPENLGETGTRPPQRDPIVRPAYAGAVTSARLPFLTAKLQGFGTTIFAEMSGLAVATGSVNLGQGFPDTDGPREVLDAAIAAINGGANQYPPGPGVPVLRQAIATHQDRFYGLSYDPDTEVLVTAGATEALAGALLGLLDTGDEVVLFEPMYDSYQACIALAGAVAKPVTLRPPDYGFDPDELREAITPKTRVLLINSPHNPTGHVLSMAESQLIADLAVEHDLIVITDEVYEHLVFDDATHIPLATLAGMRDRTLVISSGGKTFNTTGWKIGWICAPPALLAAARTAKQFLTYVSGGPFQPAIAVGLGLPDSFFVEFAADMQAKRDRLLPGLHAAGFTVYPTHGTYFVTVDIRPVQPDGDGMAFCRALPGRCGVVAVPNEVFYANRHEGRHLVRFAFCKRPEVLDEAAERLAKLATG